MEYRICKKCEENKPLTKEYFLHGFNNLNGIKKFYWYKKCKLCDRDRFLNKSRRYKKKNREKIAAAQRKYHAENKENDSLTKKKWYQKNKESCKLRIKIWIRHKRKNDLFFKLKSKISSSIGYHIKKNNNSCLKYLSYTMQELKEHIEKQFEPWMNWENNGKYIIDQWDDNDSNTWKWQIDHIIPHSTFKYISMEDEEFKKCWDLSNLRPYSAKQNIIDGCRR